MKKYINAILTLSSVLVLFYIIYNQRAQIADRQQIIDSLQQELYISNINLGRYDITLELLQEQDSIAAHKFNEIYTNETE
jgi:hypothetical protein